MPRLYHTKSKTGCTRCRARRVKCDETRPSCRGCTRHNVECVYDRAQSQTQVQSPASSEGQRSHHHSPPTPSQDPNHLDLRVESRERRLLELRLLNLYATEICIPFIHSVHDKSDRIRHLWSVEIPEMATEYEPLLHTILSLSVLYQCMTVTVAPKELDRLRLHRAAYLEATYKEHRKAVGTLSKQTADGAAFTSMILTVDEFGRLSERSLEPYEPPTQWLMMCKGTTEVYRCCLKLLADYPDAKIHAVNSASSEMIQNVFIYRDRHLSHFPYLLKPVGDETPEEEEAYQETLCYVGAILSVKQDGADEMELRRHIYSFPTLFPIRYLESLGQKKPRALLILAHYFSMAAYISGEWFVNQTPTREVMAIASFLSPEWASMMDWPLATIKREQKRPLARE